MGSTPYCSCPRGWCSRRPASVWTSGRGRCAGRSSSDGPGESWQRTPRPSAGDDVPPSFVPAQCPPP